MNEVRLCSYNLGNNLSDTNTATYLFLLQYWLNQHWGLFPLLFGGTGPSLESIGAKKFWLVSGPFSKLGARFHYSMDILWWRWEGMVVAQAIQRVGWCLWVLARGCRSMGWFGLLQTPICGWWVSLTCNSLHTNMEIHHNSPSSGPIWTVPMLQSLIPSISGCGDVGGGL